MNYLALGDSYTVGEAVPADARWPDAMAAQLRAEGIALEPPRVIARTGWTTGELCSAIDAEEPIGTHGFVTVLVGVNDQYRGHSVAGYRAEFAALLRRAVGFAGNDPARAMVLSIPDWGVTPFAREQGRDPAQVAAEIDAFNAVARAIAADAGVAFVDITPSSRARGGEAGMLVEDRLHPSAAMHALWADAAARVARRLLAS